MGHGLSPPQGGRGTGPLLRALLGCCVWPGTWASGARWAAHDAASRWATPARRRDLGLTAPAQPWPQGCPTGPHWLGVQAAPLVWGLMLWGGGLRGGQGRAQGGPSGSQPAKAWDPEPHFHETTYRVGSPCSLRPSRSVVPRRRPAPLTFLVFAQTQLRPPDSELLLSSFKSLTPSTPLDM